MRIKKLPTTVVTGFLGAGKTTLVNHLLDATRPMQIGIVVNEFGEVGIDGQLIVADENPVIEINNGCVCCTVRTDLVASVKALLASHGDRLERLIVETSGLADPAPVLQTFLADPDIRDRIELEAVVAVVDAMHASEQLNDDIAREQIAFADRVIVNKTDVATSETVSSLLTRLKQVNPTARVDLARYSTISVDALFGIRSFSLDTLLSIEPDLLSDDAHDHEHDDSIASCAFIVPGALDADRFNRWVNQLVQTDGASLLRMKGVLSLRSEPRKLHFHSVHMLLESSFGKPWRADEARESRFVVIGRNVDAERIKADLLSCID